MRFAALRRIPPAASSRQGFGDKSLQQFLSGENRYAQLEMKNPEISKHLRSAIEKEYIERYLLLKQLADLPPAAQ